MQPLVGSVPTLALSVIYCLYHAYYRARLRREGALRERVAYMLWVMAGLDGQDANAA
jgi:hypothetical protein